jgi:metal-responsive CopG/Arc/MetJ family transcriptional regulator
LKKPIGRPASRQSPCPEALSSGLTTFRFERRLSSRAEAIRELIEAGLQRAKETNRRNFS